MAKKIVKFVVDEGRAPTRSKEAGNPYVLRAPFAIYMEPGGTRDLNLGISCNLPSVLCYKETATLVAPGVKFRVTLRSEKTPLNIGEGEQLCKVFPLSSNSLDLEGASTDADKEKEEQ